MKKLLPISLILFIALHLNSVGQNIHLTPAALNYSGNVNSTITAHVSVDNLSSSPINVWALRTVNNLATGHKSSFCFAGACYGFSTDISQAPDTIPGNGSDNFFMGDLNPFGNTGTSTVCYRFYDNANPADSASVCFTYDILAGINDPKSNQSVISSPQPNPSDNLTALTYNLTGDIKNHKIAIYNILGNLVKEVKFPYSSGALLIPTSDLKSGVYFYSLISNNKVISTNKLVVAHKN